MSAPLPLFVTCPRGVEPLLVTELAGFGVTQMKERPGGVAGVGDRTAAYRACLWSRLASRVLMPLKTFPLPDAEALYAAARTIDWPELFAPESRFAIEVAGRSAHLTHTHFAALKLKDAVADGFRDRFGRRPDVDTERPDIRIHLHLDREQATISLDLAGDSLHRRGWRQGTNEAPLKENLAAALLVRAGWADVAARGGPLLDPMCGSGTLVIEAALMAADVAPGLRRERFGFEAWLDHVPRLWKDLREEAIARADVGRKRLPQLMGSDLDPRAIKMAQRNAATAGFAGQIEWRVADLSAVRPASEVPGLLLTNPPYGERLAGESEVIKLYSLLGATLKQHFGGWEAAVFTGRPDLGPRLGLRAHPTHEIGRAHV
jgi:23S rRNA (guanine2445-N2)-methyltransferase / 23S rRNA (guanine2069-N7)-methyltransferase